MLGLSTTGHGAVRGKEYERDECELTKAKRQNYIDGVAPRSAILECGWLGSIPTLLHTRHASDIRPFVFAPAMSPQNHQKTSRLISA